MNENIVKALRNIFLGLGFLSFIALVLLYLFMNDRLSVSLFGLLVLNTILDFIIAIFLHQKNK